MSGLHHGAVEDAMKLFREHKARYVRGESFDVLDWKRPGTKMYWIRMVFDHERDDTNAVYISGDLGEAVVYPTCPAKLFDMAHSFTYTNSDGAMDVQEYYFLEKVKTATRRYDWSMDDFKEDLRSKFVEMYGKEEDQKDLDVFFEEHCDGFCGDVTVDDGVEIDRSAEDDLHLIFPDWREWIWGCGRRVDNLVVAWLVAMRMAYEQIRKEESYDMHKQDAKV